MKAMILKENNMETNIQQNTLFSLKDILPKTKPEKAGARDHDMFFSRWIRANLKDSYKGYRCYDIDFVLWDKKKKQLRIIELKSFNKELKPDHKLMLQLFHTQFAKGMDKGWQYKGLHLITFEKNTFDEGKVYLNKKEINESELIHFLNFDIEEKQLLINQ
jgi:hypothetical protein